ncbi:hypothetical protein [Paenibacillus sp. E194]|uniref:hypothetical protein n=1 Tax=Paenibacillus sp. E194 TaxID=1458845 RepID=UPI0018CDF847|nr:hypothetical protein [Paenibacillus sp. E194]
MEASCSLINPSSPDSLCIELESTGDGESTTVDLESARDSESTADGLGNCSVSAGGASCGITDSMAAHSLEMFVISVKKSRAEKVTPYLFLYFLNHVHQNERVGAHFQ